MTDLEIGFSRSSTATQITTTSPPSPETAEWVVERGSID
jgi:hypothetical protein